MSLEVFEKLEAKVQQAIDTITLLQMEIEELKEKNNSLSQEVQNAQHQREELERENNHLKEQQNGWQERLQALLGRMEEVAIDDKNTTTAILFEQIVQQPVVLETFYRDYLSAKRRPSAKVGEQRFHDVNIFLIDVTKLGSIVFHRLNIQLLREFSVYRAMWAVGKIINC